MTGRFITFEGGEGVGKSTQIRRVAERLRERGIEAVVTREPGGSEGAEAIRALLLSNVSTWGMRAEALLFAAARTDHADKTIRPALARGEWVLCDRYLDSSRAYQGAAGGLGDEYVVDLHVRGADLMPDRTILLELGQDEAHRRALERDGGVEDRIGGRETAYHAQVRGAFRRFARHEPERIRTVEADGTVDAVTDRIMAELNDLFP